MFLNTFLKKIISYIIICMHLNPCRYIGDLKLFCQLGINKNDQLINTNDISSYYFTSF